MKSYESMKTKLLPTGLYTLTDYMGVSKELLTYSVGIDNLDDSIDVIIREAFLTTAEDYGLSMWEEMFGGIHNGVDADKRRYMIISRLLLNYNCFTMDGVKSIIDSLGITDYTITENPSLFMVTIDLSQNDYTRTQRKWIKQQLEELLPAHLDIVTIFGSATWDDIEALNLTANEMDYRRYIWDEIDALEL